LVLLALLAFWRGEVALCGGVFGLEEKSSSCRLFCEEKTSVVEVKLFGEGDVGLGFVVFYSLEPRSRETKQRTWVALIGFLRGDIATVLVPKIRHELLWLTFLKRRHWTQMSFVSFPGVWCRETEKSHGSLHRSF
jgi:hypothetical protein